MDSIEGLSPAISIEQKTTSRSPRSTVGTITEIYDYLRLLYASVGTPHCPNCGRPISRQTADQIVQRILQLGKGERVTILAPIVADARENSKISSINSTSKAFAPGSTARSSISLNRQHSTSARTTPSRRWLTAYSSNQPRRKNRSRRRRPASRLLRNASKPPSARPCSSPTVWCWSGWRGASNSSSRHRWPVPIAGWMSPNWSHAAFLSTPLSAPAPSATGSVRSSISTPPRSSMTGPSPCSTAALVRVYLPVPAQAHPACRRALQDQPEDPFEDLPAKQQHILVYGPPKGEAPRTGFHGILAYLRDSITEARAKGIAST